VIALAIKACQAGHRVAFATAQQWVTRLEGAQDRNNLDDELRRLERYRLLIVDEVGYLPLERQAANLLFALVSRRYERGSIGRDGPSESLVTGSPPSGATGVEPAAAGTTTRQNGTDLSPDPAR
jgi:hypothetical protein